MLGDVAVLVLKSLTGAHISFAQNHALADVSGFFIRRLDDRRQRDLTLAADFVRAEKPLLSKRVLVLIPGSDLRRVKIECGLDHLKIGRPLTTLHGIWSEKMTDTCCRLRLICYVVLMA